jgi:hypothetical protein
LIRTILIVASGLLLGFLGGQGIELHLDLLVLLTAITLGYVVAGVAELAENYLANRAGQDTRFAERR